MNGEIINSITGLHLVGYFYWDILLNILNCSMRTDGQHGAANSRFLQISRTRLKVQLYVQTSRFQPTSNFLRSVCVQLTPATDRQPPQSAYCLEPRPPAPCWTATAHLCHQVPATSHITHAVWTHCSSPCRNIWRRWTANCCDV